MPMFSIESLDIIDRDIMTVRYHDLHVSALDSITLANIEQTAVAVVDNNSRLVEISASTLAYCDEDVAAAITTLSAGDLMAYIGYWWSSRGPGWIGENEVAEEKLGRNDGTDGRGIFSVVFIMASSCSSDDESGLSRYRSGRYSFARRDAVFEAEDTLDELATEALRCKLEPDSQIFSQQGAWWNFIAMRSRIEELITRLEYIAKQKDVLGLETNKKSCYGKMCRGPSTPLILESMFYGRYAEKEELIKLLVSSCDDMAELLHFL
ncbi:hypothetical protein HAX54_034457 [Datura stramonium]|uniref:Uncharacterized protein n=1 Tax=Datura stramonium TaxID=4076 RepID=A0ABS8SF60_DATST|nr:hypothetical protein [Datura stramonium]